MENKIVYWTLQLTWGLLMTFIGAVTFLFVRGKVMKNGHSIVVVTNSNWGGISLGAFSFCGNVDVERIRKHEYGHSIQNCVWGILFPFVIGIPSAVRCICHLYKNYEDIWFENQATRWGEKYCV